MPELPEIETIKRELKPIIVNQKIVNCWILRKDIIGYPKPEILCKSIINETIVDVQRRAKYLVLVLSNDKRLIFHLRLSGAIIFYPHLPHSHLYKAKQREITSKFARLVIELNNGKLIFEEPRALGRVYLIKNNEQPQVLKGYFSLGYEPISPEFDFAYFNDRLKNRNAAVKSLLLDQRICAGVGNIYSDEALFRAGIRPLRKANRLKTEEIFKLLLSLKDVLNQGIANLGTTVSDYKRTNSKIGNFQKFLYVYSRETEPCKVCGTRIALKKVGSRSSRYCPKCQK